jgi:Cd2+/Zn2+-exporting ATPase
MSRQTYAVRGMDCANCARELETGISRLPGVSHVQVDFATAKMTVEGDAPFEALQSRAASLGKQIDNIADGIRPAPTNQAGGVIGFVRYLLSRRETQLALAAGAVALVALLGTLLKLPTVLTDGLFIVATGVALLPIARSGLNTLLINHEFNINLLMTIAAVGAVLIGETSEAATVIFLFAVGEALEGYTADRARASLRGLLDLAPATAIRLRKGGAMLSDAGSNIIAIGDFAVGAQRAAPLQGNHEAIVPVEELSPGDIILIKPGERVPMDGVVAAGESAVNQAPITGESLPVHKTVGADVFAGTVNGDGALEVRVTRVAADSTLSRIIRLVEEAQGVRAPSQRLVDQFARWYTPAVVVVAALVAFVPPLFGAPFYNTATSQGWLYRALELLVIACPCSLVISTPVTIISAITAAARRGVLIKGGAHLEAVGAVKAFAFDKTGTLTMGKPAVTQARSVDCSTGDDCALCDDVLALASAVEKRSAHPLAKAITEAAHERGVDTAYPPAEAVETLAGRGVQGRINGRTVTVGSHRLFDAEHPHGDALCAMVDAAEARGQTAMLLSDGDRVRGFIAVADEARPESRDVVNQLRALGLHTVMLTGDNAAAARTIGGALGVDEIRADLLPADKLDAVKKLLNQYGGTAMIGDGVNDTPALAAATVGVAMGGAGSAQAMETADIALMADDLRQLPYTVRLSRFARSLIRQNIGLSLGMKLLFMLLALAGGASLWLAVFADVGMSLLVTLNGMRAVRYEG